MKNTHELKLNKYALDKNMQALDIMLDKYKELEYFYSDYFIRKNQENKYTLCFEDKDITVYVENENCFLYDAPAAPYSGTNYSIKLLFSCCYYKPVSVFGDEYAINSYNRGVFDIDADLIAYKTLDNYFVVIDKKKLEYTLRKNSFKIILAHGLKYHFDSGEDEYLDKKINGHNVIKERYAIDKYYLELDYDALLSDNISDCLTIIDIDNKMLIY